MLSKVRARNLSFEEGRLPGGGEASEACLKENSQDKQRRSVEEDSQERALRMSPGAQRAGGRGCCKVGVVRLQRLWSAPKRTENLSYRHWGAWV